VLYYWLGINVVVFYVFMAYGLSLWGQYLCWAQEEEEKTMNDAIRWMTEKKNGTAVDQESRQLMIV